MKKRSSLRRQLVFAFVVFALAGLLGTLLPFGAVSTRDHFTSYVSQQILEASKVAEEIERAAGKQAVLTQRYPAGLSHGWLLDAHGAPIGEATDPRAFPALMETRPELEAARAGKATHWIDESPLGRRLLIAIPILHQEEFGEVLWVSASLRPVGDLDRRTWLLLALIGAAAMVASGFVGGFLARRLSRRLEKVADGAAMFGAGRLSERIEVRGGDEIGMLADQLNQMASHIEQLVRREKDFVAAASHQIRTPLTAIKIRIDEIRSVGPPANEQVAEYLDEMACEVDRLTALTSQLLALSAAETLPMARRLAAYPAIREAVDRVAPVARHQGVELRLVEGAPDLTMAAPAGAFEEVLFNLLDNAIKFSPRGAAVEIRAGTTGDDVVVEVFDSGPGVTPGQRERIFEPFYRGSRTTQGHGLGLAVCSRLCQVSGASLSLDPRREGGTVARTRWPAAVQESRSHGPRSPIRTQV